MNVKKIKFGYVPYSKDYSSPGDKRRFVYYAKNRKLDFEIVHPSKKYDVIILSQAADISYWGRYRKAGTKIVFDFIDSYLAIPESNLKSKLRGLTKFILGKNKYLKLSYKSAIIDMCKNSDAVICSTEEQRKDIQSYSNNVHIILDIQDSLIHRVKDDYSNNETIKIVWEGLPYHLNCFEDISEVLIALGEKYNISLHLITDLEFKIGGILKKRTIDISKRIFQPTYLYAWNEHLCSTIITSCDLAVIPLSLDDAFTLGKPENKLLLFWRMAMPTIVSATPAYSRAMKGSGLDMVCSTPQEWYRVLDNYIYDSSLRKIAGKKGFEYAMKNFNSDSILKKWDYLFESI